jgi:hypothetical protein
VVLPNEVECIRKVTYIAMTEQQETFLNALFGEANGNFRQAMNIAGYASTEYPARLIRIEHKGTASAVVILPPLEEDNDQTEG